MHHFTVDVEEYFHAHAFKPWAGGDWDQFERRAARVVGRLLEELDRFGVRGTFFTLGWLANRDPGIVRDIAAGGHELASHGWGHRRVTDLTPHEFRDSIRRTKELLEDLSGQEVIGYRAPSFSIVPGVEWAFDVLLEEGYRYDSSLFPVHHHPSYGYPSKRYPHTLERPGGDLLEFPLATVRFVGRNLPAAGGAYLRFFPYRILSGALRAAQDRGRRCTVYLHPWELDGPVSTPKLPPLTRARMFHGSGKMWACVRQMFREFQFTTIADTVSEFAEEDSWREPARRIS